MVPTLWTAHATAASAPRHLRIIVLAGQSNAEGYESYARASDGARLLGTTTADASVAFTFRGDYTKDVSVPPVALDHPQVIQRTGRQVFGPEIGMARYLWTHDDHHHIAVVKVVHAASSLASWMPGHRLLKALTKQVSSLERWEGAHGVTATVAAIVWMQGETESLGTAAPTSYRAQLQRFLPELRLAVGATRTTPVVVVETSTSAYVGLEEWTTDDKCVPTSCANLYAWNTMVRAAQAAQASRAGHVFVVDSATYPRASIQLHLNATGELELGSAIGAVLATRI